MEEALLGPRTAPAAPLSDLSATSLLQTDLSAVEEVSGDLDRPSGFLATQDRHAAFAADVAAAGRAKTAAQKRDAAAAYLAAKRAKQGG